MEDDDKVRMPSYGGMPRTVQFSNLSKEELDKLPATILSGAYYDKGDGKGRISFFPVYDDLPDPIKDKEMLPFWRPVRNPGTQGQLFSEFAHSTETGYSPSITITSLCGYNYSPENYQAQAENLKSWGFEQLRSQRGDDFRFSEIWYLRALFSAKGALSGIIKYVEKDDVKLKVALEFLKKNASFGSLDVSTQRLAAIVPGAEDM